MHLPTVYTASLMVMNQDSSASSDTRWILTTGQRLLVLIVRKYDWYIHCHREGRIAIVFISTISQICYRRACGLAHVDGFRFRQLIILLVVLELRPWLNHFNKIAKSSPGCCANARHIPPASGTNTELQGGRGNIIFHHWSDKMSSGCFWKLGQGKYDFIMVHLHASGAYICCLLQRHSFEGTAATHRSKALPFTRRRNVFKGHDAVLVNRSILIAAQSSAEEPFELAMPMIQSNSNRQRRRSQCGFGSVEIPYEFTKGLVQLRLPHIR